MARRSPRKAAGLGAAAAMLVLAGVAAGLVLVLDGGHSSSRTIEWRTVPHLQTGPPPWPSESTLLPERLGPSGLHAQTMEGAALHIHAHLDLYVHGRRVPVSALVGIDPAAGFLTELHTHDASGIIHVESPTVRSFTLGQFFCEWGVKLTATCLGPYKGELSWWVNGTRMQGDPARLVLRPHQEIVIAAGGPPVDVPASFAFPPGL